MKYLSLVTLAILLSIAPCRADEQSSLFRAAYACSERGPSSVCVFGTIPEGMQVTILAKGWKSSALQKETFANDDHQTGVKTITRLQVAKPPPKDASVIAILAAAPTITELPLKEVQDEALVARIGRHIKNTNELNLDPDIRLLKTRLLRLSPTILLSETFLSPPHQAPHLEKQLSTGCGVCEYVPLLVGPTLEDLFKGIRSSDRNVESTCGGIRLAFALAGRSFVVSDAEACESDSFSAVMVHDLSGDKPKLVFELSGGL